MAFDLTDEELQATREMNGASKKVMSEEFSIDVNEKSIEELRTSINNELEARHQRFMNGTETEDDLINGIYHYKIKNNNGLDLDVVEMKYYNKIIDLYNKEKEKNKELEKRLEEIELQILEDENY